MTIDLTSFAGDTAYFNIAITLAGVAQDITGWHIWFTAKTSYTDADIDAIVFKYTGAGVAAVDAGAGTARVTIDPSDTADLQAVDTTLVCDVQVQTATDEIYTVDTGTWQLNKAVTRATAPGAPMLPMPLTGTPGSLERTAALAMHEAARRRGRLMPFRQIVAESEVAR